MMKRIFDIIVSLIALFLLSPFFILISIILRFTGEGEIFYLQDRVGYLNKPFKIIKFATMLANSENIGTGSITVRNDPRVLPFGKFLRKTKINELPQFINVLLGNMSLVGPRPQLKRDFEKFHNEVQENMFKSKPGITGLGSIIFRDEEKWISNHKGDKHKFYKDKIAPYKGELELWYYKNQSFYLDLKILIITLYVVFKPDSGILFKTIKNLPKIPSYLNI